VNPVLEILNELKGRKIRPRLFQDRRKLVGPENEITSDLVQRVREHNDAILALLSADADESAYQRSPRTYRESFPLRPCSCGSSDFWLSAHRAITCYRCNPPVSWELVVAEVHPPSALQ